MTQLFMGHLMKLNGKLTTLGLAAEIIFIRWKNNLNHAGDTALFSDMKLIGPVIVLWDVVFYQSEITSTMGPEDAAIALLINLKAKNVRSDSIQYFFPLIEQDPIAFCNSLNLEETREIFLKVGRNFKNLINNYFWRVNL